MKPGRLFLLIFITQMQLATANPLQTLPPYHWANSVIRQLQLRGFFTQQFYMNQPFTRIQIARELDQIRQDINQGKLRPSLSDQWRIYQLMKEFSDLLPQRQNNNFKLGVTAIENGEFDSDRQTSKGIWRTKGSFSPSPHIELTNSIAYNQYLSDDPNYQGELWRGYTLFTEQAFARIQLKQWQFTFGRDFQKWGPGKDAGLVLSDFARPLDQISARFRHPVFQFSFILSMLDNRTLTGDSLIQQYRATSARRYLVGHRLDIKLRQNLQIGFSEVVLYGGPDAQIELSYFNPFLHFYGEVVNTPNSAGNILGTIDFIYYPIYGIELYGEFLVDDIQVEKTGPSDLEPNELGILIGLQLADPLLFDGMTLGFEFTKITNRTYNTVAEWEKYLHRNQPIAHFLGNDFERFKLDLNYWLTRTLQFNAGYEKRLQGEGSILKPFDEPWLAYTVAEGYHETSPFGIVQHSQRYFFEGIYQPSHRWHFSLSANYTRIRNFQNVPNARESGWNFRLGLWLDWDYGLML